MKCGGSPHPSGMGPSRPHCSCGNSLPIHARIRWRALTEMGKLERTSFLLDYFRDEALRRRILIGLNKGDALHALARQRFFGQLGELRDRAFEDQIHRASCLHLRVRRHCCLEHRLSQRGSCDRTHTRRGGSSGDPRAYRSPEVGTHQPDGQLSFHTPNRTRSVPFTALTSVGGRPEPLSGTLPDLPVPPEGSAQEQTCDRCSHFPVVFVDRSLTDPCSFCYTL